jgi:hypothetical protein
MDCHVNEVQTPRVYLALRDEVKRGASEPSSFHANGYDSWYRRFVIWFFFVHWALLRWPVLAGLAAAAAVSVLMGGFGFAGPLLPCAIMFCGMGLVLGLVALAVRSLKG